MSTGPREANVDALALIALDVSRTLAHLGVRNIDMPVLPDRVWEAINPSG